MQPNYADAPRRRRTGSSVDALAAGLGWFSLALGAAELLAPRAMARCIGLEGHAGLIRAYGVREIVTGVGILRSEDPRPWIWGRVGGDLLDLATLCGALDRDNRRRSHAGLAAGAVAAVTLVDLLCARSLAEAEQGNYIAPDYRDRSGFPKPAWEMRGAAAKPRREERHQGGERPDGLEADDLQADGPQTAVRPTSPAAIL